MGRRLAHLLVLLTLLVVLVSGLRANPQKDLPQPSIPKLSQPSGPFGVGRVAFDWINPSGRAEMTKGPSGNTELMVYLWYPTDSNSGEVRGALLPGASAIDSDTEPGVAANLKGMIFGGNWPLVVSGAITSHAQDNAPMAKSPKTFPVILFSPMAFATSFQYSSAIEDLVSHGYVVASIEHTSEVFGVAFLNGRSHTFSPQGIPQQFIIGPGLTPEEFQAKLDARNRYFVEVRAADTSFALDKLIELNRTGNRFSQFSQRLDLARVAAVGHSRGGWSAILACRRDERIKACVNLDGNNGGNGLQFPGAPAAKQPILYVEVSPVLKPSTTQDDWPVLKILGLTAEEWVRQWHETVNREFSSFSAGGYFVQVRVPGIEHYSFSDEVLLQAAKEGVKEREETALRNLRLAEDIVRAFLDEVLKKKQARLRDSSGITVKHFKPKR